MQKADFLNEIFGKNNRHFNDWYIEFAGEDINTFLNRIQTTHPFTIKAFASLYMYVESFRILKDQTNKENDFAIKNLCSLDAWYCSNLLLAVSLIDQFSKSEIKDGGEPKKLIKRFVIVLNCLEKKEQHSIKTLYLSPRQLNTFKKAAEHIYKTRNFFAHELHELHDNLPQEHELSFSEDKKHGYVMHPNISRDRIILYTYLALFKYLGYQGDININSTREFNSLVDFLK